MKRAKKVLMTGNAAAAEAAIRAGCRFYFGYPITPQNEVPAYMSRRMPEVGGTFIQAESEIAAINMVYGAAAAGARAMTSSSSPGISLKQEGISYLAGSELPAVIMNVQRGGPGLGDISVSQADYFQATRGGGHGDYRVMVLAPWSVQEMVELMTDAFDLADMYRTPVLILSDARLGQMMEPLVFKKRKRPRLPRKTWALTGAKGRSQNIVKSFYPVKGELEEFNRRLQQKYKKIQQQEVRCQSTYLADARVALVAYGTAARICKQVVEEARADGHKVGLIRPVTLWPFPTRPVSRASKKLAGMVVVEMSSGQMLEDVKLAVAGRCAVAFVGRTGGGVPTRAQIRRAVLRLLRQWVTRVSSGKMSKGS